jgi:hypothetical protein
MKREKLLTKKERKAAQGGPRPAQAGHDHTHHIHCVACGRHIEPDELQSVVGATAVVLRCQHGSQFAACAECEGRAQALLDEHDRTGRGVAAAPAWH